jgi:hypothetical protein
VSTGTNVKAWKPFWTRTYRDGGGCAIVWCKSGTPKERLATCPSCGAGWLCQRCIADHPHNGGCEIQRRFVAMRGAA